MTKTKQMNVRIPEHLHKEIKFLSIAYEKSQNQVIVDAIQQHVNSLTLEKDVKQLKHAIYKLKYDAYKDE